MTPPHLLRPVTHHHAPRSQEKDVKKRLIKKLKSEKKDDNSDTEADSSFKRGDKVEARYRGGAKFYPGVIKRDNRDDTYDIDYDDGEKEQGVKKRLINKLKSDKSPKKKGKGPRVGEKVKAQVSELPTHPCTLASLYHCYIRSPVYPFARVVQGQRTLLPRQDLEGQRRWHFRCRL